MTEQVNEQKRLAFWQDGLFGSAMLVAGLLLIGGALYQMRPQPTLQAQAPQSESAPAAPAESTPGGTRPTTPPPEPARPQGRDDNDGRAPTTGASPPASSDRPPVTGTPLPQAPAEKSAPPIDRK